MRARSRRNRGNGTRCDPSVPPAENRRIESSLDVARLGCNDHPLGNFGVGKVRVFISWSGELSRALAHTFSEWLPSALQFTKPYFSPNDIDKGVRWSSDIEKELLESSVSLIFLTRENLQSSWIMFEAGAISTKVKVGRVCPIVFDMEPTDVQGPLAQFQATKFEKYEILKLLQTINSAAESDSLPDAPLTKVFEKWWPDLDSDIRSIISQSNKNHKNKPKLRDERDLLEEILSIVRRTSTEENPFTDRMFRIFDERVSRLEQRERNRRAHIAFDERRLEADSYMLTVRLIADDQEIADLINRRIQEFVLYSSASPIDGQSFDIFVKISKNMTIDDVVNMVRQAPGVIGVKYSELASASNRHG